MALTDQQMEHLLKKARRLAYNPHSKEIQYPGRNKHKFNHSKDIVGNNKAAQKAIREFYGLKG